MMRFAATVAAFFAILCPTLKAQTSQRSTPEVAVPTVTFPLRNAYTRLHPDRVAVLDPRFDESPADALKVLVVFSGDGVMVYDPVKNQPLWPAPFNTATEPTLLTLNDERLIFATTSQVICVDRSTGAVRWRFGEKTSTNPDDDPEWQASLIDFTVAADRLICINDRRELMCVNTKDGSITWRVPDGPRNPGFLAADAQFVVTYDENAVTASLTSRYLETGNTFKTAAYDRGTILQFIQRLTDTKLLAVTSKQLVSFDSGSLALNWRVTDRPVVFTSTLLIDNGNIFVSDDGKTLTRYIAETGERIWRSTRLATRNDNVLWTVSAGSLIVAATPRVIGAYDAGTGRRQWRHSDSKFVNEQPPVLIRDALLCYGQQAPATRPASQPASSQPAGNPVVLTRISLVDGAGGDSPESTLITQPLQSFGGVYVRNHAVIVLDGNRLIGYVDESVKSQP